MFMNCFYTANKNRVQVQSRLCGIEVSKYADNRKISTIYVVRELLGFRSI